MRANHPSVLAAAVVLAAGLAGQAAAQSAAERAVEAAKQYAGTEITIVWRPACRRSIR